MTTPVRPDLDFSVEAAEALRFSATPCIAFKLRVLNRTLQTIHTVILKVQIQLDVSRRHYTSREQSRLADLFGETNRWGETLRPMLWTNTNLVIASFRDTVSADLQVPCTFDFNVSATKYFAGIQDGEIPISFFFSGTIFYATEEGTLQVVQIPWEKEAAYRLPIRTWRNMMDAYYPNTAWLCLERQAFDLLYDFKLRHGFPTFEEALTQAMGSRGHE